MKIPIDDEEKEAIEMMAVLSLLALYLVLYVSWIPVITVLFGIADVAERLYKRE